MKLRNAILAVACATTGIACSQGTSVAPTPTSPGIACPALAEAAPRLIYPSPGATGVSTSLGEIIVTPPYDGSFTLVAPGASPLPIGPPGSVPSPAPTALPTNESFVAVPVPALSPATAYVVVYATPKPTGQCPIYEGSGTIGTFST
jgi:hypothetical protein